MKTLLLCVGSLLIGVAGSFLYFSTQTDSQSELLRAKNTQITDLSAQLNAQVSSRADASQNDLKIQALEAENKNIVDKYNSLVDLYNYQNKASTYKNLHCTSNNVGSYTYTNCY